MNGLVSRLHDRLRSGDYLTPSRLRLWGWAFAAGFTLALIALFATAQGLNDYAGRPLGTDFSDVYAAGSLAADGKAAAAYDFLAHHARERAIFGDATPFYGWHYPPFFLLIAQGLSFLPYLAALLVWQGVSLALYFAAMGKLLGRHGIDRPPWRLLALAFPAVFVCLTHGQNGFLTAALFAGALALLGTRPLIAGVLFGLCAYKPQFCVLIPLVLIAGRQWRALAAAAGAVTMLALIATAAFGPEIWQAFLASTRLSREVVLEQGGAGFEKIISLFSFVRLIGGKVLLAYLAQGALVLLVLYRTIMLWRSPAAPAIKGAALVLGTLLVTPYALDYDLMLAAPAIALLIAQGRTDGFSPWRKTALAVLWLMPIAARPVETAFAFPLALTALAMTFLMCTTQKSPPEAV